MIIDRREAIKFIKFLCEEIGVPIPLFGVLHKSSYDAGAYFSYKIELQDKVPAFVAVHEFMHYVIDLIKKEDENSFTDDTLEHRFIFYISNLFGERLYEVFKAHENGKRNNRTSKKRRAANS
jgi:hypothetical protein